VKEPTIEELKDEITTAIDDVLHECGIVDEVAFDNNKAIRDVLIRLKYRNRLVKHEKADAIICSLAVEFSLCRDTIYSIIHKRR